MKNYRVPIAYLSAENSDRTWVLDLMNEEGNPVETVAVDEVRIFHTPDAVCLNSPNDGYEVPHIILEGELLVTVKTVATVVRLKKEEK